MSHRLYCITQQRTDNFKNLRNLAKYKFFKLPEYDMVESKHVGVNTVSRESIVIYICALIGCHKNNIKMHHTCIKIVFR
jgi:hypothetical protein